MQGLSRISFQTYEEEHRPHPVSKLGTVDAPFLCSSGLLNPDPFSKFELATGTHSITKAFQVKSPMQQIVIFDADDYPGLLQGSFKAFSYSSFPSFQLKLNKGLKKISLVEIAFLFWKVKPCSFLSLCISFPSCFLLLNGGSCFEERCVSLPATPSTLAFDYVIGVGGSGMANLWF